MQDFYLQSGRASVSSSASCFSSASAASFGFSGCGLGADVDDGDDDLIPIASPELSLRRRLFGVLEEDNLLS